MSGQVDQVQTETPAQLVANTAPDTTVHGPAMQHHQVGTFPEYFYMQPVHVVRLVFIRCFLPLSG